MELKDRQNELIQKFIDCSLTEDEAKEFRNLFEDDEQFAQVAEEETFTASALEAIGQGMRGKYQEQKKTEKNRPKTKNLWLGTISIAAAIAIILSLGFFLREFKSIGSNTIVETDTIYLPKNEYFSLPDAIVPVQYAQNMDMEKLVDMASHVSRGNDDICLPPDNVQFKKGENIDFSLPGFKPGEYRLNILGFHEHITAVDTICSKTFSISQENKHIYIWKPEIIGVYYWMIYIKNNDKPFVVRKLSVKE